MSQAPIDAESMYAALLSLWVKYCGIADECDMLKDKWDFVVSQGGLMALPPIAEAFRKLLGLFHECEELFSDLAFRRDRKENIGTFVDTISGEDPRYVLNRYNLLQPRMVEMSMYLEILRMVFFQRTVSEDISQTIAGYPHSPERTAGNELVYLAADKVAKSYYRCLWFGNLEWDSVISFIYPMWGYFHGAFVWPAPYSRLFHISLSAETKYLPAAFLSLAHEMAHVTMRTVRTRGEGTWSGIDRRTWAKILHEFFVLEATAGMSHIETLFPRRTRCQGCILNELYKLSQDNFSYTFEECITDLISVEVGGLGPICNLRDSCPSYDVLFRIAFLVGYYFQDLSRQDPLLREMSGLQRNLMSEYSLGCDTAQRAEVCVEAYTTFAATTGAQINRIQSRFDHFAAEIFPNLYGRYVEEFEELGPDHEGFIDDGSILSRVIRPDYRFPISYPEESEIEKRLQGGVPIYDADPRKILDVYYKIFRQRAKLPDFPNCLTSLAFNKTVRE